MKKNKSLTIIKVVILMLVAVMITSLSVGQVKYHTKNDLNLLVSGTSTLHDWDMKAAKGECIGAFTFDASGKIAVVNSLSFITPAEGLKSEHSGMDKNAYKALKTNANPNILFILTSSTIGVDGLIKSIGKLTIAGTTQDVEVVANYKINIDKSITISGSKNISMKDFNINPPSFMMGTIKTGNDIVLKFDLTLRK